MRGKVFSGARSTGRQHIGSYLGAIRNCVAVQEDYDCVYCVVDLHALTTLRDTSLLKEDTYEMVLDWLAADGPGAQHHLRPIPRSPGD